MAGGRCSNNRGEGGRLCVIGGIGTMWQRENVIESGGEEVSQLNQS